LGAMMTTMRLFMIVAVLATIGCDQVYIDAPIGEKLTRDKLTALQGKWVDDEQNSFELHIAKDGQLIFGSLSWDDKKQKFEAASKPLDVRTIDDAIYVFVVDDTQSNDDETDADDSAGDKANADDPNLIFFRVDLISESEMHLFMAESKMMRDAITSGKLGGRIEKRKKSTVIFVNSTDKSSKDFVASKQWGTLFGEKPILKFKLIKKEN
jgi:hypothetical protein